MTNSADQIKTQVREHYRDAALQTQAPTNCGPACGPDTGFGSDLYTASDTVGLPASVPYASLGCGNPTAVAELRPGETVLDLGSGAGLDVFLSARRVGSAGKVYGLDMTDEMLDLARRNQAESDITNVEFVKGDIENIPLPDDSVDVIISNCVINLSPDKPRVFHESNRVLAPGGRFAVTDIITTRPFSADEKADMAEWTGCISGALSREEFVNGLHDAGFSDVEVQVTHDVGPDIVSAIVRATA
jgi:SAM-dependent methyltransferase